MNRPGQRRDGCNPFPFAPGVIDADGARPKRKARYWLASDLIGALALVAAAYFVAGLLW